MTGTPTADEGEGSIDSPRCSTAECVRARLPCRTALTRIVSRRNSA